MPLRKCPECHKEISTSALRCPHCGKSMTILRDPKIGGVVALLIVGVLVAVGVVSCYVNADDRRPTTAATNPTTQPQGETERLRVTVRHLQEQLAKLSEENASLRRQLAKAKNAAPAPPANAAAPKINWGLDLGTLTIDDAIKRFGKPVTRTSDGERKTKLTWKWYADGNPDVVVRTLWAQFDARGKIEDYEDTAK